MSTESGAFVRARAIRPATLIASSTGSIRPSGNPKAHATPALVVAIAVAPRLSKRRALPASQAFGSRSGMVLWCRPRKTLTNLDMSSAHPAENSAAIILFSSAPRSVLNTAAIY
jgi:hypothetical protein